MTIPSTSPPGRQTKMPMRAWDSPRTATQSRNGPVRGSDAQPDEEWGDDAQAREVLRDRRVGQRIGLASVDPVYRKQSHDVAGRPLPSTARARVDVNGNSLDIMTRGRDVTNPVIPTSPASPAAATSEVCTATPDG